MLIKNRTALHYLFTTFLLQIFRLPNSLVYTLGTYGNYPKKVRKKLRKSKNVRKIVCLQILNIFAETLKVLTDNGGKFYLQNC